MRDAGVRDIVFSSTCATYGLPETTPITEEHSQRPINPYGASKLMVERMLQDFDRAYGLRYIVFRYFNAAGAHASGSIGEWHQPETHLIPLALEAALGLRGPIDVYGTDYPTEDGTCVRDYIHVSDLARAHLLGLRRLQSGSPSDAFNLGNGTGFSVTQVLDTVETVTGRRIARESKPRRSGDPHTLIGSAEKAKSTLGWNSEFGELDRIIETAWRWRLSRPDE
jgi:UDP-glucose-4-epimerase GalE